MTTSTRSLKSSTADLRSLLRRQLDQGEDDRVRRLVRMVSPDRTAVRPSLAILALEPKREPIVVPAGYPFTATGPAGSVDLLTVRDEYLPAVRIETAERVAPCRMVPERGELSGLCLHVANPSAAPVSQLRFFVHDLETLAWLLTHGECVVRTENNEIRPAQMQPSGIEFADDLYPTPSLGCRGRSLWSAFVHAPFALAFVDLTFAEVTPRELDVLVLFRNPVDAERIDPAKFQLGCVPVVNRRALSVNVTVEPTRTFEPIPVPSGQTVAGIGRVQAFRKNGDWADCRPWLGTRYPWKHRRDAEPQYVLSARDRNPWFAIGLVELHRGLEVTTTNLNVELILADAGAGRLGVGAAAVGDRGEQAAITGSVSPLLVPLDVEPLELEAETCANGWLSRSSRGDVTDGLRALLNRAAGGVGSAGSRTPRAPAFDAASLICRATVRSASATGPFPLLSLEVELNGQAVEPHMAHLFALVLERSLPLFAPALTGTQLTLQTLEGARQWQPRWPAA
jgi:hypothetical protein